MGFSRGSLPPRLIRTPGVGSGPALLQGDLILTDYTYNNPVSKWERILRLLVDTPRRTQFSPSQGPSRSQFTWVLIFRSTSQAGKPTPEFLRSSFFLSGPIHTSPTVSTGPLGTGKVQRACLRPSVQVPLSSPHHSEGQGLSVPRTVPGARTLSS